MIKVKICGIQTIEDVQSCIRAHADFIGLNFVRTSKRRIDVEIARKIRAVIPSHTKVAGIFQNQSYEYVNMTAGYLDLDFVQLHGDECPAYVALIHNPVIKAFHLQQDFNIATIEKKLKQYQNVSLFLFDRKYQGKGATLPFEKVAAICQKYRILIAGGFAPENIHAVVKEAHPYGVDVAKGIETDGVIDFVKVARFIFEVKRDSS